MNRAPYAGLTVEITAHQWWWDVRYDSASPSQTLRTSNELHLPAGVPVQVILKSADVIHSFWIPNMSGKQDLIPGRNNDIVITPRKSASIAASAPNICGLQHAHMAFDVTVEPLSEFEKWWAQGCCRRARRSPRSRRPATLTSPPANARPATISPARQPPARSRPTYPFRQPADDRRRAPSR